jgi:hypothetical protein
MGLFVPLYGPFRACLKRVVLFSVLRADPSGPAQMYTYS